MKNKRKRAFDNLTLKQIIDCAFAAACDCDASKATFARLFGVYVRNKIVMVKGAKDAKIKQR